MISVAEIIAQAKTCQMAGDPRTAEQLYRRALEVEPGHAEGHYLLGEACLALGKLTDAATALERAVRLKPDYAEAHNTLGTVLGRQARLHDATACFQRALELRPGYAEAYYNLAAVAVHQHKLDEAAACWRRAVELKPDYVDAYTNLAMVALRQDKLEEAAACWRRVLELKPDFAEAHNNLGAVWSKQGRFAEAAACYRRALQLKPDSPGAHNNLATVLRDQNKLDDAVACCRRALELKPDYVEAHANLAAILEKQSKLDEAAACYRRALELKPDYAVVHNNLGAVLEQQGKLDEAAACWRRALKLKPDFAEAHNNLGSVLERQDKLDEAAACYRRALEFNPDFAKAHHNLGAIWDKLGQPDAAIACWRRVLELQPDFPEASGNLGILLAQQGKVEEAKACYLEAMRLHPEQNAWKLNILSLCPIVSNSNEEIEHLRRTLLRELEDFAAKEPSFDLHALATAACTPSFSLQFHGHNDRPIRAAYARLFRNCFPSEMPTGSTGRPRIGFVVTDRHEKLFLKSMRGVLERIDPDLFELVVIGTERGIATIRADIQNPAVRMLPVRNKFDPYVQAIRDARFDLLYYWEVATDNVNYFLPFLRLAPVQCTSWGIQVTSGIPQLDHYISSELAESEDARSHYTENLVLARTLLTYQQRVSVPSSPKPRRYFGIAPDQHLYLCAQQLGKFQPDFDPILAGILRRDADGVVVITEDRHGGFIANQLRQRFAATMGDVAERIVFIPLQPNPDYLSLVAAADVLLDPLHFGGVNSSYDGFSLNKPIVTLPSQFQRGRYTLACYKKMGILDCVASDPRQYIDIAVALGTDAAFRDQVVEKIRRESPVLFEDLEAVREGG